MRQSKGRKFENFRRAQVRLRGTIFSRASPHRLGRHVSTNSARSSPLALLSRLLVLVFPHKLRSETACIGASLCSASSWLPL